MKETRDRFPTGLDEKMSSCWKHKLKIGDFPVDSLGRPRDRETAVFRFLGPHA